MEETKDDNDFTPREYQVEILERSLKENTIIYMPTGSGKTFIASMVIKTKSRQVEKLYTEGGKRIFFLVNTVALVSQQATAVESHTPFSVGQYSGDMGVDYWSKEIWNDELDKHQVLVMTAQIFLDLLLHSYLKFDSVCLLILDECHHSTNKHCMKQIMEEYACVPNELRCHVIGLTATLLNANCRLECVDLQVQQLENILCAKVVTAHNKEMIKRFSTNPIESIVVYNEESDDPSGWRTKIDVICTALIDTAKCMVFEEDPKPKACDLGIELETKTSWFKKLQLLLTFILECYDTLGLYAAFKAALVIIIRIEKVKITKSDSQLLALLDCATTQLHYLRKLMFDDISKYNPDVQPLVFSSDKLRHLLDIAQSFDESDYSIVFVEKRITAAVLCYIFQDLQKSNPTYERLKPDFIVGFNNNSMNDTREALLKKKSNEETLKKFRNHGTNILFSSDVIEEGIDIPLCNQVIKFDLPMTYRSYVQSKGRARHPESKYIILVSRNDDKFINTSYNKYKSIEQSMFNCLGFNSIEETDDDTEFVESYEPYGPQGPKVTPCSAISLVNRYCHSLPHDRYSNLSPSWWSKEIEVEVDESVEKMFIISVKLPINCPLRETLQSKPYRTVNNGKKAVAVKVCQRLHELNELDDKLLPYGVQTQLLEDESLFPYWINESNENGRSKTGTRKCKRRYERRFPPQMCDCRPLPDIDLYIHVLEIYPDYQCSDATRDKAFYNHLRSSNQYAILCSKKWPNLCEFFMFMNVGKVKINVKVNAKTIRLTKEQIHLLFEFHTRLFRNMVPLVKNFMLRSFENKENAYFLTPVIAAQNEDVLIDWETVNDQTNFDNIVTVLPENRKEMKFNSDDYVGKVVIPWYRPEGYTTRYIVTDFISNLNPNSPFPSENYESYAHYFKERYNLNVENVDQPLIEVRAISSRLNCLLPRGEAKSRRQRKDEKDFEEILIPEFCTLLSIPSVYMLKGTLLPSVLHRVFHLLNAEELRRSLAQQINLGVMEYGPDHVWDVLKVDELVIKQEDDTMQSTIHVSDQLTSNMKSLMKHNYPWNKEDEPRDLERHLSEIDIISIIHYQKFIDSPNVQPSNGVDSRSRVGVLNNKFKEAIIPPPLFIFETKTSENGPQLCEMLQALTAKSAADIINYERLETLGDSFLKFIVTLCLYTYYDLDEGKLTEVKGKLVGNRNLNYVGNRISLGELLKVEDFSPSEWNIPCFPVEESVQKLLKTDNKCASNLLHPWELTSEEVASGIASIDTLETIATVLESIDVDRTSPGSSIVTSPKYQLISDKTIADCVEAIIGLYLKSCGILGSIKLCNFLGILAPEISDIQKILFDPPTPPRMNHDVDINNYLIQPDKVEKILNYRFKDRKFLLQALTHSSFTQSVCECYQRLEFIGDAVLDFLITVYIYQNCGNLSPGELTDLRSALVNNVTFACLVARYGLHLHLNYLARKLSDIINRFAEHQENRGHKIGAEVMYLIEENDIQLGEIVDVPKVLGDLFESIIAAVYLDSGKSLETTWKVIYHLMHKEIEEFCKDVPKNHIRILYEKFPNPTPKFGKAEPIHLDGNNKVCVPLMVTGNQEVKIFHGIGKDKSQAKLAAAKVALRFYHCNNESPMFG